MVERGPDFGSIAGLVLGPPLSRLRGEEMRSSFARQHCLRAWRGACEGFRTDHASVIIDSQSMDESG
jgi:hypothetical protein